jgi:hypothetical protein
MLFQLAVTNTHYFAAGIVYFFAWVGVSVASIIYYEHITVAM